MPVRATYVNLIIYFTTLLLACAGGNPRETTPEHLTAGMAQIKKGNELYHKGCYERSLENYFRAHELFAVSDQLNGVAMSLNNIGNVYRLVGDIPSSLLYFDDAYRIYTTLQDHEGMIHVLSNKAAALLTNDQLVPAETVMEKAIKLASAYHIELSGLNRIKAVLHIKKKEYQQAEDVLNRMLNAIDKENLAESAAAYVVMGNLMIETHHYRRAIGFFEKALIADQQSGFHRGIADDLAAIGSAYQNLEEYQLASHYFQRSVKVYALIGNRQSVHKIIEQLNEIAPHTANDTTITQHFVERWMAGEGDGPCD